jgi:hypothetical protein
MRSPRSKVRVENVQMTLLALPTRKKTKHLFSDIRESQIFFLKIPVSEADERCY